MDLIQSFFSTVGTWFGFVGSCVAGPDAVCRPFIGFVMLATTAAIALYLVVKAYRAARSRVRNSDELPRRTEQRRLQERVRLSVTDKVAPRPASHGAWRLPA
jgi:hypothetical protein